MDFLQRRYKNIVAYAYYELFSNLLVNFATLDLPYSFFVGQICNNLLDIRLICEFIGVKLGKKIGVLLTCHWKE